MRRRESQQSLEENRIWSLFLRQNKRASERCSDASYPSSREYAQPRVRRVYRPVLGGKVGGMDHMRSVFSMVNVIQLVYSV